MLLLSLVMRGSARQDETTCLPALLLRREGAGREERQRQQMALELTVGTLVPGFGDAKQVDTRAWFRCWWVLQVRLLDVRHMLSWPFHEPLLLSLHAHDSGHKARVHPTGATATVICTTRAENYSQSTQSAALSSLPRAASCTPDSR